MQDLTIETMSLSVSGNPHRSMAAEEASEGSVDATKAEDNNKVRSMETRLEHLNVATGRFEARATLHQQVCTQPNASEWAGQRKKARQYTEKIFRERLDYLRPACMENAQQLYVATDVAEELGVTGADVTVPFGSALIPTTVVAEFLQRDRDGHELGTGGTAEHHM